MACPKCENQADSEYSGVPGVLARMVNGRIAGRVKPCPECKKFKDRAAATVALLKAVNSQITWLEPEERAYYTSKGREIRKGRAIWPDGVIRSVYAGVPDTFFSIPAHGSYRGIHMHGFLTQDTEWIFHPDKKFAPYFEKDE